VCPATAARSTGFARYGRGMQGTVASYDADGHDGSVLLDDGTPVAFDAAAFAASGLRQLRLGQRVKLDTDAAGRIIRVTLPTLP
jgi:2-phospho-L-lactate/phosphoenolpyruvate guanylyltransferase